MASRRAEIFIFRNILWRSEPEKYFSSLLIRDTSLLTCLYIGELHNALKFKCENKPFIVFILILRRVLF